MKVIRDKYKRYTISLSSVDSTDMYFRVSKPIPADELVHSVCEFGIIEPPLLEKKDAGFRIVTGFNRIESARRGGQDSIPAFIADRADADSFMAYLVLKSARGSMGPVGRIRAMVIMERTWSLKDEADRMGRRLLGLPADFMAGTLRNDLLDLPPALLDYLDIRDPGFRTIRRLCSMPPDVIGFFDSFAATVSPRVNIFRSAVDLAADILARDGMIPSDITGLPDPADDRRKKEESIHEALFNRRYPTYSEIKSRADRMAGEISTAGVTVRFPENFEGGTYSLVVSVTSGDTEKSIAGKLGSIDTARCAELARLL